MVAQTQPVTKRWTAEEVLHLVELGLLHDEHVELIQGELVVVPPRGPVHSNLTVVIRELLADAYGRGFHVRDHSSITAGEDSLPEPDLAVIRGRPGPPYTTRLPGPADAVLIIEISHTTRAHDRRKADVYAAAGFETYWLVDVDARRIELRTSPQDGEYTKTEIVGADATLELPATGATVTAAQLLP